MVKIGNPWDKACQKGLLFKLREIARARQAAPCQIDLVNLTKRMEEIMAIYQIGSKGPEVARIQRRLQELGNYLGPIDGIFGGGTEAAIRTFQQSAHLGVDGRVGGQTWATLFPGTSIAAPAIASEPLQFRCVALTGAFETNHPPPDCFAGLSGDFDGQGISFGVLQWNLGQGSLQALLREMNSAHPEILQQVFDDQYAELQAMLQASLEEQLRWARSIQNARHVLDEPWQGKFKTLGRQRAFQDIQVEFAGRLYEEGLGLCTAYGLSSARAAALMFDIKVQNGSISDLVRAQIEQDFKQLDPTLPLDQTEVARMQIIANRRANAANPAWVADVRARKLTIANGQGKVHGSNYNLQEQYGIDLSPPV
jgi:hypothetical protein